MTSESDLRRCIQCGGWYGGEFFYSNGRGGMRPRCIGCMMTRLHNQKRKLFGLPPYSEAAPFIPLRKLRTRLAAINMRTAFWRKGVQSTQREV